MSWGNASKWCAVAVAVVGLLVLGAVSMTPVNATADDTQFGSLCTENGNTGTNSAPCFADDRNMDYCTRYPWPTGEGPLFTDAMKNLDAQTDMYRTYRADCGPHTDIGGYQNVSPEIDLRNTQIRGAALCTKPLNGWGNTRCDQGSMIIHWDILSNAQASKTMCHEIGHFTGLYHYSGTVYSCMVSGSSTRTTYNASEVSLINNKY